MLLWDLQVMCICKLQPQIWSYICDWIGIYICFCWVVFRVHWLTNVISADSSPACIFILLFDQVGSAMAGDCWLHSLMLHLHALNIMMQMHIFVNDIFYFLQFFGNNSEWWGNKVLQFIQSFSFILNLLRILWVS